MIRLIDQKIFPLLVLAAVVASAVALWMIFMVAPVEVTMGVVQKIFYVHVPSALASYAGFTVAAACSLMYLLRPRNHWDVGARAGAELGLLCSGFTLFSGALWGSKAWGTYWVWDPQLTATLILFLLYFGYVLLRFFGGKSKGAKKMAAVVAIIALVNIPIIHYSVKLWGGLHPVVEREGGEGLAPEIASVFGVSMLAFMLVFFVVLWMRVRVELAEGRVEELYLEVEDLRHIREEQLR